MMIPVMPEPRPPIEYATKADLELLRQQIRADLAELEGRLAKQNLTTLIAVTAIFGTLVTILKLFA
jgi:hypothetical protein